MAQPIKLALLFLVFQCGQSRNIPPEQRLLEDLFKDYNPTVRPARSGNDTVFVNISLSIESIVDLDLKNEVLSTRGFVHLVWNNPFLTWNSSDYEGLESFTIDADKIWIPDLVLENALYDQSIITPKPLVYVGMRGYAIYTPPFFYRSECEMDIVYYPFDRQICYLTFESWSYDQEQLLFSFHHKHAFRWKSFNQGTEIELVTEQSEAITRDEPYRQLVVVLHLRRKPLYHLHAVILPSVIVSMMSLLIFHLSPESGEKISLGVTIMLVFHLLSWSVAEKVPESGDAIPLISIYLSFVMFMCAVSVVMSVLVLNVHGHTTKKVPKCVKWLLIDTMAPLLGLGVSVNHPDEMPLEKVRHHTSKGQKFGQNTKPSKPRVRDRSENSASHHLFDRLQDIVKAMREVANQMEEISETQKRLMDNTESDWKTVAKVIDRMLFWLFFILLSVIAIVMLFVMPFVT